MPKDKRSGRTWYQQDKEHARLLWRMGKPLERIERALADAAEPGQKAPDRRTIQRWIAEWEAAAPLGREWTFGDLDPDDERLALGCWAVLVGPPWHESHAPTQLPTVEAARLMANLRRAFPDLGPNAARWVAAYYSTARASGEATLAVDLGLAMGAYRDFHRCIAWLSGLRARKLRIPGEVMVTMEPPEFDSFENPFDADQHKWDLRDRQGIRLYHVARRMGVLL